MSVIATLAPPLALLVCVLVCALPWGAGGEFRLVQPLLPYVLIHLLAERRGTAVPDWLVFLSGFAIDVVGQGPLGFWPLIYLSGYTMIRSVASERQIGFAGGLGYFAMTIVCLAMMQWSVASVYYLRGVEILPLVIAAAAALLVYLLLGMFVPRETTVPVRKNLSLERGA